MMNDLEGTAARLYPSHEPPPPVEKATSETTATKTAEPVTAHPDTNRTGNEATTTDQRTDLTYALALPADTLLDASAIERTTAFAKAHNLAPEVAQHALDHAHAEVAAYHESQMNAFQKLTRETWPNEAKNDSESVMYGKQFFREFGDERVGKFLDDTGWGSNPDLIRMLSKAMKQIDRARGGGAQPDMATRMYGKSSGS